QRRRIVAARGGSEDTGLRAGDRHAGGQPEHSRNRGARGFRAPADRYSERSFENQSADVATGGAFRGRYTGRTRRLSAGGNVKRNPSRAAIRVADRKRLVARRVKRLRQR